jgi:small subunit ribosomal protein S1
MTPDDSEDFAKLLAEYEKQNPITPKRRGPQVGEWVKGPILSIAKDAVFVDLGAKSEGVIDIADVRDSSGKLTVKVGDIIEACVISTDGGIALRRALGRGPEAQSELAAAHAHGIPIEGQVTGVNKGGVDVQIAGQRAFCPISQLDLHHVADAKAYVGQRFQFRITRLEQGGPRLNLVVSRRVLLEEESQARAAETRARLRVGAVLAGQVTQVRDFGAFVDVGGIEGLLHVSELGFGHVGHPSELVQVGQTVEVQVLKIEQTGDARRPEKLSLSLKSLAKDPWDEAARVLTAGLTVQGKVVRLEPFGAFVAVAPGVEGLVHVSELGAAGHVRHPRDAVKVGQTVTATVLAVDHDKRRISLSLAPPDTSTQDAAEYAPPQSGFGTFADLLGKGGKGKSGKAK